MRWQRCPACGMSAFVKLFEDETGVRCLRCGATPVHLAAIEAVDRIVAGHDVQVAYEMSSCGALLKHLRKKIPHVVTSEYMEDVEPGSSRAGMRCEDVQKLSFPDAQFDLCTSTEVFEHVPDDAAGFAEIHRVLKRGGAFVFTVPLSTTPLTVERAAMAQGETTHLLPATYHTDRPRGAGKVLVFRDYGRDICDRLVAAGFEQARICDATKHYFGYSRQVVVANK